MERSTYRRMMLGLLAALVVTVGAVWLINPLGDDAALPDPLEEVHPLPGDTVVRQTVIEVDLPVGYSIELEIDGVRIPANELGLQTGTGRWSWGPGPGRLWEAWSGGDHTATVRWQRTTGASPDSGEFSWAFRVI